MAIPALQSARLLHAPAARDLHRLPDWAGERVAIVCSGQSALHVDFNKIRGRMRVVAVNTSWELVPWCDVLYACDFNWWQAYQTRGWQSYAGLKVTQDQMCCTIYPGQHVRIEVKSTMLGWNRWDDQPLFNYFGQVASGNNGGYQMLNLVAQMGASGIALIGCDIHGEHWHGRHPPPCSNPFEQYFVRWREAFNVAAPILAARGSDVVNCSEFSTVTAYPKITVDQMLERWKL